MQSMVREEILKELPKERVFEEIKKIFLKSKKPSIAFYLLNKFSFKEFGMKELFKLQKTDLQQTLQSLDNFSKMKQNAKDETEILIIMLALLVQKLPNPQSFLLQLTNSKKLLKEVLQLHELSFDLHTNDKVAIAKLAKKINIRRYSLYLEALYPHKREISHLREEAKKIGVYEKALPALVNGDDLIKQGLKPSKNFQKILTALYNKQLEEDIKTKEKLLSFVEAHPSYF
ncbi:MAG: hypothetical protein ABGW85_08500, partial [Sulfurimonas sp.]